MRKMVSGKEQEVLKYIAVKDGKIGTYVSGTFAKLKPATVEEGAIISIAKNASGLANKSDFDDGDYLPFFPDIGELKYFNDYGMSYWVYSDAEHRYYTSDTTKTFVLQGSAIEVQEGTEAVADVTTGKQFKAFVTE